MEINDGVGPSGSDGLYELVVGSEERGVKGLGRLVVTDEVLPPNREADTALSVPSIVATHTLAPWFTKCEICSVPGQ